MQLTKPTLKQQAGFGITAFLLIAPLTLCFAATTGQSLLPALVCTVVCSVFSIGSKNSICAPHPLFIVPFVFVCSGASFSAALFSISLGACIFILIQNKVNNIHIPDTVLSGGTLGLCLGATILLTNTYFGIGAFGTTPLEMLRSYRSLGFHPHFMGLLTGTITLFAMITYPFKFKKLNKIIPAPFITIAIPYVLNLFLNPDRNYTTINEAMNLTPIADFSFSEHISSYNLNQLPVVLKSTLVFLVLFFALSKKNSAPTHTNIFSLFPVMSQQVRGFGITPATIVIALATIMTLFCSDALSRIPLHSAGSMLIVFAWQSLPYKKIAHIFKQKEHRLKNILSFIICAVSFVIADVFTALIMCILICVISTSVKRKELE